MAIKRKPGAQAILDRYRVQLLKEAVRDAERADATRALASFKYLRGDLHMHTVYSDGSDSVQKNVEVGTARGLDFMFVTDHGTIRQRVECAKYKNVWWGQEPGAGAHHIGILDNERKFTPSQDMRRDAERLREMGCFFWYPHPCGWYPYTWYSDAQIAALKEVDGPIAIEVINGIYRPEPFYDEWVAKNVRIWDDLLCEGRRVTALAATDSHIAVGVGNSWTGVLDVRCNKKSVIDGLRSGNVFASMGPAVNLTCGKTPMGGEGRARGGKVTISIECADSRGLHWLKIVQNGRVVKEFHYHDKTAATETATLRVSKSGGYIRAECASVDDLRAYANPIYLAPAR